MNYASAKFLSVGDSIYGSLRENKAKRVDRITAEDITDFFDIQSAGLIPALGLTAAEIGDMANAELLTQLLAFNGAELTGEIITAVANELGAVIAHRAEQATSTNLGIMRRVESEKIVPMGSTESLKYAATYGHGTIALAEAVRELCGGEFNAAGMMGKRRQQLIVSTKLAEMVLDPNGIADRSDVYGTLGDGGDGKTPTSFGISGHRLWCMNMMEMITDAAKSTGHHFTVRHYNDEQHARSFSREAARLVDVAQETVALNLARQTEMLATPATVDSVATLMGAFDPSLFNSDGTTRENLSDKKFGTAQRLRENIIDRFAYGENNAQRVGQNYHGAFQAFTEFATHGAPGPAAGSGLSALRAAGVPDDEVVGEYRTMQTISAITNAAPLTTGPWAGVARVQRAIAELVAA